MPMRSAVMLLTLLGSIAGASLPVQAIETCHVPDLATAVQCGKLPVPLDPANPAGESLTIGFVRLPAFNPSSGRNPLFFLAGGPGQAATPLAAYLNRTLADVRRDQDIVLIDQRGTGRSGALQCETEAPVDFAADFDLMDLDLLQRCIDDLPEGIEHYTTANAIADFEAVRVHLGYDKVDLLGGSYGSRAAIAYLALAGDAVGSVILDGVAPPAVPIGLFGQSAAAAFDAVLARCATTAGCEAAFPNLRDDFLRVSGRLREEPIEAMIPHPSTGEPTPLRLWHGQFISLLRLTLYSPTTAALLPLLITEAAAGNYLPMMALASNASQGDGINMMLNLTIICNEDFPRFTPAGRAADADNPFGGDTSGRLWADACALMPRFAAELSWMKPAPFPHPALLLSGARDPVTPPSNGEAALALFQNARHLVAGEAAHIVSGSECGAKLVADFLANPDPSSLDGECLDRLPKQRYRLDKLGSLSSTGPATPVLVGDAP